MSQRNLIAEAEAARGSQADLRQIVRRALDEGGLHDMVAVGIVARDTGLRNESIELFDRVVAREPTDISSRYEKAILFLHEGGHLECAALLRGILKDHPHEDRSNLLAARVLHALGAHEEASECLDRIDVQGRHDRDWWDREIQIVYEFGRFVEAFPKSRALTIARDVELSGRHLNVAAVADQIAAALREGAGFSLIRAGDGEGAFVRLGNVDECRFPALYRRNRIDRGHIWFNGTVDVNGYGFLDEASKVTPVIATADIVGLPYPNWIEHEFRIISVTGISSLTNVLRVPRLPSSRTCTQLIHVELHNTRLLYDLIRSQRSIGLISCHPEIPDLLKRTFNLEEVEYHHVPGEKAHSHLLSESAVEGIHWPNRYREIMDALDRPADRRLYLVAAGILGKLYCDRIKRSGGVALDIGSIADGWVGSRTRPGLEQLHLG